MRPHSPQNCANDTDSRRRPRWWQTWLETIGLVAALVTIGALVDRADPFLLRRGFSWFALAPLLAGLQYGSANGLGGAAIQALALTIAWRSGLTAVPDSAAESVLGWLIAGLAAGEFRDSWFRRADGLQTFADHLRARLESLGRGYLALKISHDRLQRAAAATSPTLRDALSAFCRDLAERPGDAPLELFGERILALFCEQASVRAATLHPVDRKGRPGRAAATLGAAVAAEQDPLVRRAARTGLTVSIRERGDAEAVLVAVPLLDVSCRVQAVVAIHEMPFLSLHAETLELLAVLGGRLGEAISRARPSSHRRVEAAVAPARPLPAPEVAPAPARVEEVA